MDHVLFSDNFDPVSHVGNQDQYITDDMSKKKRPPNAFIRFCLENRKAFRNMHPEKSNIEVSTLLASEWNKLTEEQKNPYKVSAQEDQKKFKESNPEYGYERAKQRRVTKKNTDFDPKQHFDIPDIVTLVNLPPEQLRTCLDELKTQLIVSCQGIQQFLQQDNDTNFHGIDETFTHNFQNGQ